jgi:hypothetical protein
VDNNTTTNSLEGARSAENTSDNKQEQPTGVEGAGSTEVKEPAGSMGVEAKEPEDGADMDTGDTSGVSEMAEQDTEHASKSAADLATSLIADIDEAIKTAAEVEIEIEKEGEEDETEEEDGEKEAGEKLSEEAAYVEKLAKDHGTDVEAGYKVAAHVHDLLVKAAEELEKTEKKAMGDAELAAAGGAPVDPMAGGAAEGGEDAELDAVAAALAEANVSPDELAAALEGEMAGGGEEMVAPEMGGGEEMAGGDMTEGLGEADQMAALEQALAEAGVSPEELAAAAGGEGGGMPAAPAPAEETMAEGVADEAKAASDKEAKIAALKNQLVDEIKRVVGKK